MKTLDSLTFQNHFHELGSDFYSEVMPQGIKAPHLISGSKEVAKLIGLNPEALASEQFLQIFSGNTTHPAHKPLAMVYAGHQFGGYSPQLGDGRAILLAEVETDTGLYDLVIKGAGMTPYSRFGDGRAVLRSSIREYLCSEAMAGLGIPTSRALCLIGGKDQVIREEIESSATVVRVAKSHIRFGSFEYFFYRNRHQELQKLADYTIARHFPELNHRADKYPQFFLAVIRSTAKMIAFWQAYGFCHGVMNTDNMSILGLTFDYGPFAFMDDFDPGHICNHSDHGGRYAFDRQPHIGLWNLNALAHALSPLMPKELLGELLSQYEGELVKQYASLMRQKMGLINERDEDQQLLTDLLKLLADNQVDYTIFFRQLCEFNSGKPNAHIAALFFRESFNKGSFNHESCNQAHEFHEWESRYQARLQKQNIDDKEREANMKKINPKFVLRNYLAENAIRSARQEGDFTEVNRLLDLLYTPYDEHPELEQYAQAPPAWGKCLEISCSS